MRRKSNPLRKAQFRRVYVPIEVVPDFCIACLAVLVYDRSVMGVSSDGGAVA